LRQQIYEILSFDADPAKKNLTFEIIRQKYCSISTVFGPDLDYGVISSHIRDFMIKQGFILSCFLGFSIAQASAQNLSGEWAGALTQNGKPGVFTYQINIVQHGDAIFGTAFSNTPDGKNTAHFNLTGAWDDGKLILQEIVQTEPATPRWCLKYAILKLSVADNAFKLEGDWKADGCAPGKISLTKRSGLEELIASETELFSMAGRWTGTLSQSDRNHDFFYEIQLSADGRGISQIVAEDNGGSANHRLEWSFSIADSSLIIEESALTEKTDPRWKWCIKSARLRLRRETSRYVLEGSWEGYIEGNTPPAGRCAPGVILLEKPILTRSIVKTIEQPFQAYEVSTQRQAKIMATVEVKKPDIRIKIWDNGTVDGDVASVFLNGQQLVNRHRVTKHKYSIPVTLKEDNNFLILHAEDLGDISPNTVAVSVDDGVSEQIIVVSSNLKESGAILIRQFKIE